MKKRLWCSAVLVLAIAQPVLAEGYRDPYEGYNRFMFRVNDTLDRNIMVPVAKGYRKATPSPLRIGVRNFFNNLRDVVSFGSNVLRLDIEKASTDLVRVGINSTFGLGGLIDIADAGQMPNNKSTLGDTFASWGWKNSNYFVYPLGGPSTVRDSIGSTLVAVYPVKNAFLHQPAGRYGTSMLNAVQQREYLLDLTESLEDAALDRYAYVRDVYMSVRNRQIGNTAALTDNDIDIDSLVPADEMPVNEVAAAPVGIAASEGVTNAESIAAMASADAVQSESASDAPVAAAEVPVLETGKKYPHDSAAESVQ